ncbi:MAG: hypothetical protein ABSD48_15915 [Armatimonadota bacterium]
MLKSKPGRPKSLGPVERRLGIRIEQHAIIATVEGRTARQIAAGLGIHVDTLRRWLRERGYRVECSCHLVRIVLPEQGGARRTAIAEASPSESGAAAAPPGSSDSGAPTPRPARR